MGDSDNVREQYQEALTNPDASETERMLQGEAAPENARRQNVPADKNELLGIIHELYGKGVLSDRMRENMIRAIGKGEITTVDEIDRRVTRALDVSGARATGGLDKQAAAKATAEVLELHDYDPSDDLVSQQEPSRWDTWKESVGDWFTIDDDERTQIRYKQEMLSVLRSNNELTVENENRLVMAAADQDVSVDEFEQQLIDAGVRNVVLEDIREQAVSNVDRRYNTEQRVADQNAEDTSLRDHFLAGGQQGEADLTQLRKFQRLDEQFPSKYKFDSITKNIYVWDVDELSGFAGWVPLDENDQPKNILDVTEAEQATAAQWAGEVPEWVRMSQELGTEVREQDYFGLLHVVQNPEQYGADPARYLPGMPDFLGGFESTWGMDRSRQTPRMEDWRRIGVTDPVEAEFLARQPGNPAAHLFDTETYFSRPHYDENDQWALFVGLAPEDIADIQSTLIDVGALTEDDITRGYWGTADAVAMEQWLTFANSRTEKWNEIDLNALREHYEFVNRTSGGTSTRTFTPPAYQRLDEATANQTIKAVIRQQLGREPTDDELASLGATLSQHHRDAFVADVEAARSEFNASVSGGTPGEVQDVDYEARFLEAFETNMEPQLESFQQGQQLSQRQQTVGSSLDNVMRRLGGGIG